MSITVSFNCNVIFEDPTDGYYDYEDKVWVSFSTITKEVYRKIELDWELFVDLSDVDKDIFSKSVLSLLTDSSMSIGISVDEEEY